MTDKVCETTRLALHIGFGVRHYLKNFGREFSGIFSRIPRLYGNKFILNKYFNK